MAMAFFVDNIPTSFPEENGTRRWAEQRANCVDSPCFHTAREDTTE